MGPRDIVHHTRLNSHWVLGYVLKYVSFMLAYDLVCLNCTFNMGRHVTFDGNAGRPETGKGSHLPTSLSLTH